MIKDKITEKIITFWTLNRSMVNDVTAITLHQLYVTLNWLFCIYFWNSVTSLVHILISDMYSAMQAKYQLMWPIFTQLISCQQIQVKQVSPGPSVWTGKVKLHPCSAQPYPCLTILSLAFCTRVNQFLHYLFTYHQTPDFDDMSSFFWWHVTDNVCIFINSVRNTLDIDMYILYVIFCNLGPFVFCIIALPFQDIFVDYKYYQRFAEAETFKHIFHPTFVGLRR
jgi:hypothetical protein